MAERLLADVAVVGAGPAGIAAACVAAEAGRKVVLIDEGRKPGGQIWRHRAEPPAAARAWLRRLAQAGVTELHEAVVYDGDGDTLHVERRRKSMRVKAPACVLAPGAREHFLPFPGWTLPASVGVGAAQALVKAGASFAGRRVVVAGSGPLLLPVAATLAQAGAVVALVAEQAPAPRVLRFALDLWRAPAKLRDAVRYRYRLALARVPYRLGTWVLEARGDGAVEEVLLTDGRRTWSERCDVLCCAYGLVPNTELAQLLGCALQDGAVVADAWQATTRPGVFVAGEPTGIAGVEQALVTGRIAGLAAAGLKTQARALFRARDAGRAFATRLAAAFALRPELRRLPRADTLVCRCEDVPYGLVAEGGSRRELKLRTRAGMGACQGRVCGPALEFLTGAAPDCVRPPLVPVPVALMEED